MEKCINLDIRKIKIELEECKNALLKTNSLCEVADILDMDYMTLHRLTRISENSRRQLSEENRETVERFYKSSRASLQLPYKKYAKKFYLHCPLAVAFEEYVNEQHSWGCQVLSKSSVYRCLKKNFVSARKYLSKNVYVTCV